jgi:UDP-N-acetylmuramyl pentapeptide phosphotransferase/UDP-N-acetylglucosamine-1-phosphate transferase
MIVALTALLLSLALTGVTGWHLRRKGMLAHPDGRSSHQTAAPSGGGLGMIMVWLIVSVVMLQETAPLIWSLAILPGAVVLAIVGWIDDHRPLRARLRFAVQLAVSIYVLVFAWYTGLVDTVLLMLLAGIWLLSIANFYNFMDGSHGMAGTQGIFSGLMLAWLFHLAGAAGMALVSIMVACSSLGFLPWNLTRRRIFMGDAGSVPLGFVLASLCAYGVARGYFLPSQAILVLAVFIVDASLTLIWRVLRGEQWYTAHRQHLYQQLIARGCSHESVLVLYTCINIVLVLPAAVVTVRNPDLAWFITPGLIATMIVGWILAIRRLGVTA